MDYTSINSQSIDLMYVTWPKHGDALTEAAPTPPDWPWPYSSLRKNVFIYTVKLRYKSIHKKILVKESGFTLNQESVDWINFELKNFGRNESLRYTCICIKSGVGALNWTMYLYIQWNSVITRFLKKSLWKKVGSH